MSKDPSLPVSLTDSLTTDPARTVAADAVYRETAHEREHAEHDHAHSHGSGINWLDPELLSVIGTFIFMLLGKWGTAIGLPAALGSWFFLAAYLAGGWHGAIHGVRSVLKGQVDVDLLMILAALGAAFVNHAFEARCCSSFSRSRTRCRRWPSRKVARPFPR